MTNPILPTTNPSSSRFVQPPPTYHLAQGWERETDECAGIPEDEAAKWHCCRCRRGQRIFVSNDAEHIIGALSCSACPHKPCNDCTLSGIVKLFVPLEEPTLVPVSEVNNEVWFGTVCGHCGLSWRAKELGRQSKGLKKMPNLGHLHRSLLSSGTLRKVRSRLFPGSKSGLTPPNPGKQAKFAAVRLTGYECTCRHWIDEASLCFQVFGKPTQRKPGDNEEDTTVASSATSDLQAMGHHEETIVMSRGIRHANPLRSNPVTGPEALDANALALSMGLSEDTIVTQRGIRHASPLQTQSNPDTDPEALDAKALALSIGLPE
ncbi:hypothetical protein P280DRAFT_515297 [Massarina eburnea CBS 473.64]|uniref:Probable double zinc ribbon domain-containing protein n=1 Tax=Massarina eburnea CBS 473.64 TaxID=1395130 RepID=A0A6A6SDT8_9PLEO|nr:hypothetical protein P280DRAFT_515297 [Massarina eburnea CBS 473.64]